MDNNSPSMLKSTLIGGAVFGLLGGLPLISALNLCCCLLVMAGGFLAAFLYSKECANAGVEFRPGGGATVGLVAGLFYTIVASIIGGIVRLATGPPPVDDIMDQMESGGAPPELIDAMGSGLEMLSGPMGVVVTFFMTILAAAVFSTIGGLIGGAVFKVEPTPPAPRTIDVPPPTGGTGSTPIEPER